MADIDDLDNIDAEGAGDDNLDQLQPEDTLVSRGVDDVLDEGYVAPDNWSPGQGFGNTPNEMRRGETIEQRTEQEQPEVVKEHVPWNPAGEDRQVGDKRAGRLVDVNGGQGVDNESESIGRDVGIDGGAASAEEAAMHIIDWDDKEDPDA
ncbi:DUF5709 domain-containing protein [Nigerium massiliense]|uniref:DUF5709 domain-containing protein n=1 Tax=Nigerium massiliense TaxID=1522317 RepID=UPI0005913514|nr:DUF5709 domain-containing protein [Nigerium massiliense]